MIDVANYVPPMLDAATSVCARTGILQIRYRTYPQQSYAAETAGGWGKTTNVDYNCNGDVRDTYAFGSAHPSRDRGDAVIGYRAVE